METMPATPRCPLRITNSTTEVQDEFPASDTVCVRNHLLRNPVLSSEEISDTGDITQCLPNASSQATTPPQNISPHSGNTSSQSMDLLLQLDIDEDMLTREALEAYRVLPLQKQLQMVKKIEMVWQDLTDPLHYMTMMNKRVCSALVYSALLIGFLYALLNTLLLTTLQFCGPNIIHHFSCEAPQLFKLSCSNTFTNQMVIFTLGSLLGMGALLITLASYIHIISAVLKIHSTEGKRKAFSTCSSHVTIVVLYYGTTFFKYLKPTSKVSQDQEMAPSIVYFIVTPMLNPIIYSLRNQEVKRALINMLHRKLESENA